MRGRSGIRVTLCLLLSLFAPIAPPARASGEQAGGERAVAREILARLEARLARLRTMKGRFIQSFTSAGLGVPQTEEGTFFIKSPNLMRWEYERPEKKLAVCDGDHTWFYLPEEGVVYRGTAKEWREGGAFAVLVGGDLISRYEAIGASAEEAGRPGNILLTMKPRGQSNDFDSIEVEIDPRTLNIATLTAIDAMGNRIGLALAGVEENVRLSEAAFVFSPPRGSRVIDQDSGAEER